jgi:hypothetical protein
MTLSALAADSDGKWEASRSGSGRVLMYSGVATVLGKATPVTVKFFCDTTYTANEKGALGFGLTLGRVAALTPFHFDDFEGPDAPAGEKELLVVTITRKGKAPLSFKVAPSGSYPETGSFTFEGSDVTHKAVSTPKSIIRALGDDAEELRFTVTDYRNAKLKLDLTIPVAGKQADFKALLAGVK